MTWPEICVQTCNSTTLHTCCTAKHNYRTAKHNYRTAQHNYICFLVISVETHPFLLQLIPMLEKSGDPYGTMYNKKTVSFRPKYTIGRGNGGRFQNLLLLRGLEFDICDKNAHLVWILYTAN